MHQTPSYPLDPETTALLVVDGQLAFGNIVPVPGAQPAVQNMTLAIAAWLAGGGLVILTKHVYKDVDDVGSVGDFIPGIFQVLQENSEHTGLHEGLERDGVVILLKTEFNAFVGTSLEDRLRRFGITTIMACGLTTPICVEATVRGGTERGFKAVVLEDACASQAMGDESAEQAHKSAIGRMSYVFAQIIKTREFVDLTSQ